MATSGNGTRGAAPEDKRASVRVHGLWLKSTNTLFDICIVNFDAGSYFRMTPEKDIVKADKDKKYRYIEDCLERRHHFTPLVFSDDIIMGKEARSATWKIASHLRFKLKRYYSYICMFVRMSMALDVVQSNTLLMRGGSNKEARIRHHPELSDRA